MIYIHSSVPGLYGRMANTNKYSKIDTPLRQGRKKTFSIMLYSYNPSILSPPLIKCNVCSVLSENVYVSRFKGTVPRDFRLQVFFMNQFPQAPEYNSRAVSKFFRKVAEIFAAQGPPPANDKWKKSSVRIVIITVFCLDTYG
jgi:hypothetical protein